ncbi:MAG: reactive intermediate/imine deaminase [Deltaproteobacteria bacterium GWC2_56_8]|nr:MAG: reactive intermediate/imine deaminase [Deltaproteobacteria bacterium GWB2_55_19]OGP38743.1 MAG: reactive intermediate/imine deaminase [Deltaproteobacteria bacterium GWC2_56_8]HAO93814.1 reactive intermediate/imine deaminase [Deltaproteobacteria bacterium]
MQRKEIKTDRAPRAIGPYSQAVQIGRQIYLSGQIPIEPMTGEVVPGDIKIQTRQVLRNLQMVLSEAGAGLKDIVKTTVFLKDLSRFAEMNGVYGEFFMPPYPARATVEVSGLPKGVEIEIDAIAVIDDDA